MKINLPSENKIKVNQMVEPEGENSIDSILSKTQIPHEFDFISIDIDTRYLKFTVV